MILVGPADRYVFACVALPGGGKERFASTMLPDLFDMFYFYLNSVCSISRSFLFFSDSFR